MLLQGSGTDVGRIRWLGGMRDKKDFVSLLHNIDA